MPDALTVQGLMAHLQKLISKNAAVAALPVVLASDSEATLASPVPDEFGVSFGAYEHAGNGGGRLSGGETNCIVIWPSH